MRVLVVEDDRADRALLSAMLHRLGHEVIQSEDGDEAWTEFQRARPDVVVTDWLMPGTSGIELCRRIREDPTRPYTYIIVVTGLSDPEHALAVMQAGADDHLAKPLHPLALEARMVAAARVTGHHTLLLEQRRQLVDLHREAAAGMRTDPVTGVGNRLRLAEDLEVVRARANRYGQRFWLALCDLDRFEAYNRDFGAAAGNELLRAVSTTLRRAARRGDSLYRTGSDEFLVLLPEQDEASAEQAAGRLRAAVEATGIPHPANRPWGTVTATVAVTPFLTADPDDVSNSLALSAEVIAAGKRAGRNRVSTSRPLAVG